MEDENGIGNEGAPMLSNLQGGGRGEGTPVPQNPQSSGQGEDITIPQNPQNNKQGEGILAPQNLQSGGQGEGTPVPQNPQNDRQGAPQRICKKCLLREMDEGEYFKNMYEYIAQLDSDIKAEDTLYEERLAECKACGHLMNGMCRVCGCFVEMRAAVRKNYCPGVEKRW